MSAPPAIADLVERFDQQSDAYKSGQYNEAQLRQEFIDPMFKALGWDMENISGYAEAYKDVIHEDAIKIGGATKAPDYCFRIGGTRKFFLEAKKPSVDIKSDAHPAFQLRRYAWSAKLPLSVLTDFEEFAAYDCRVKPALTDNAATARVLYFRFAEYISRWDEIEKIFSRESILKGSFDKFAESTKAKRGTAEVDDAFLDEIEKWRADLAANLALRNPALSQRDLNFAVQRTIDRIVFLRICEDRRIEVYGRLMALLNGEHTYTRLQRLFREADERYNSGLFHFQKEKDRVEPPDDLTPGLEIDDAVLKKIIQRLYYPNSPYEFSVLPADILGQVYEQFLGKVIRLTEGHRAKVEDKPEVKKAGGVYYTPTYIVDYIVKNTVGKLLENKTPKQASKLRILDPACGSGSFLIGAYQYLLDWHRDWFASHDPKKSATGRNPVLYQAPGGEWKLTTTERKRILLQNIFGVDIDAQAVETTKLSLLLKVLEGESEQTLATQLRFYHERALPDLGSNIKCGNSLIGPDFYQQSEMLFLDEEERYRINVFDWKAEFSDIMKAGGFDAVIGNPPYGVPFREMENDYLADHFPETEKFPDSYCLFMVEALRLVRDGGFLSFIVPNTFCDLENCDAFRGSLLRGYTLQDIWQSGWAFKSAIVDTLVFRILKRKPMKSDYVQITVDSREYTRTIREFLDNELAKIDYRNTEDDRRLLWKIKQQRCVLLGGLAAVKAGVKMYERGQGTPPQTAETMKVRPFSTIGKCPHGWRPLYRGEDISRYEIASPREFVNYGPWLAAPRSPDLFVSPKLLMRRTDDRLLASIDKDSAICVNSCHVIKLNRSSTAQLSGLYVLGLLNSKLLQRVFELQNPQMVEKVFAEIKVIYVERLPIRAIDMNNRDKARHDRMVDLVERMLDLHKQFAAAKTAHSKTNLQRQIDATDVEIDKLVYELYELTPDEIKIVETAT
jgi:type I restriction-modification system DNA methylase subunit